MDRSEGSAPSSIETLIRVFMDASLKNDKDKMIFLLDKLNLQIISEKTSIRLLSQFLGALRTVQKPEYVEFLIKYWDDAIPDGNLPTWCSLLKSLEVPIETLKFAAYSMPTTTCMDTILEFIDYSDNTNNFYIFDRIIDDIYGELSINEYRALEERCYIPNTNNITNEVASQYFKNRIASISNFAEKPSWVRDFLTLEILPSDKELNVNIKIPELIIPSVEEATEARIEELLSMGFDNEDIEKWKEIIEDDFRKMTMEDYVDLMEPICKTKVIAELENNEDLFRLFGPAHAMVNDDLLDGSSCSRYGGCRMFKCNHYEEDDFEGIPLPYSLDTYGDWFTGSCEVCLSRIRYYWYAVRMPVDCGGWVGCFCSWDCVRNTQERGISVFGHELINLTECLIKETGIQDRLPDPI